jgi:hypothetical protein
MKFTDKRTTTTVPFDHIKVGECFITSYDNHINMKLWVSEWEQEPYNGVDLVTGKPYYFENDEEVISVNAEVTAID